MRRRLFLGGIAVLAGLTFAGCSTVSDSRADRGTGVAASYAAPFEEVWAALPGLLKELGIRVTGQNANEGYMLVEGGGTMGDSATIYVERIGTKGNSRVEVALKGTLGINLSLGDMPKDVHNRLAMRFKRF
ncbi:MAG: hypothetical protein K8F32_13775 [Rhodocyclaceae bacterium]|jgi:hypothetical protein|nr:hypothetical protein [Rhodocyclaceae bacterium]GIK26229.1 MAG: hypothetical protein BroJett006_24750 [Betaproteobacteria bacterium]